MFKFLRKYHMALLTGCCHSAPLPATREHWGCPASLPPLLTVSTFCFSQSQGISWHWGMVLTCISTGANNVAPLFMCSWMFLKVNQSSWKSLYLWLAFSLPWSKKSSCLVSTNSDDKLSFWIPHQVLDTIKVPWDNNLWSPLSLQWEYSVMHQNNQRSALLTISPMIPSGLIMKKTEAPKQCEKLKKKKKLGSKNNRILK